MVKQIFGMLCASIALSQPVFGTTVDFEGANDLDSFTVTSLNPGPTLTAVSSGGVADSGALIVDAVGSNVDATYNEEQFNFSGAGKTLQASIFFKFQDFSLPPNNSRNFISVGFFDENSTGRSASGHNGDGFGLDLKSREDGQISFFAFSGSGGSGFSQTMNFVDGNWYQLVGEFENLGTGIAYTGRVNDFGTDGTLFQGEVWSLSITRSAAASILSDGSVWPGFSASSEGGTDIIDNFAFVPEPVGLDIKPDSDPNSVNLKSRGVLPVAILTTDEFDALQVDLASIVFGDPVLLDDGGIGVGPLRSGEEDVNDDGLIDLTLKFSIPDLIDNGALGGLSMEAILTGETLDGMIFEASDSIRLVPPGDSNNDFTVDAADYTIWANEFGIGNSSPHFDTDYNDDGSTDSADYTIFANHFGESMSAPAGPTAAAAAVPEPSTFVLSAVGFIGLLAYGWRRRRRA